MAQQFFAYIRVSTAKQGDKGVSLIEQHDAILRYSQRYGLTIARWFEERETAAKRGRPIFAEMLGLLRRGKASGVIIHKIDRSARNLKDWADLGDLIDVGVEVHFANESLDLNTRGGRLSADIQAVVAADYIRNLREEAKKGFYGRLKQGIYPMLAPIGYLDQGAGKPKEPDEAMAPLVAQAFELYGTAKYSLPRLVNEMHTRGLRNRRGGTVTLNGMSTLLNNPFYVGVMRIRKTREIFQGAHRPIVCKSLFDRVQMILDGKTVDRKVKHEFIFRRMVRCGECGYTLIGELQKGHVYYRCHTATCDVKTVREERIDEKIAAILAPVDLHAFEVDYLELWFREVRQNHETTKQQTIANHRLRLDQIRSRLGRLTDAYIDGSLDKVLFDERKGALILEEAGAKEKIASVESGNWDGVEELQKFLELAKHASDLYKSAIVSEKRDLVKKLTSNLTVTTENIVVEPLPAVQELMKRPKVTSGGPKRGIPRTWNKLLKKLQKYFKNAPRLEIDSTLSEEREEITEPRPNPFTRDFTYEPIKTEEGSFGGEGVLY